MSRAVETGERTDYLERLRRLVCAFLQPYQVRVYLFGSYARGDQRTSSDVDIAVDSREALPVGLLSRLREMIEESDVPYDVEIVDLAYADDDFRARVLGEGILWNATANDSLLPDKRLTP